jgi:hypothetical protein
MTDETSAPIGHNSQETLPTVDALIDDLTERNKDALEHVDALLERGQEFLVIENDEQDAQATEFMVKVRARWKASEAERVAEKAPYDDRAGAIHAFFKTRILDLIGLAPANKDESFDPTQRADLGIGPRVNMAQTIYKRRKVEEERKRREEEARKLREAEEAARRAREVEAQRQREEEERARRAREEAERKAREEAERAKREADAAAAKARQEAEEAAAAAARKRNASAKAEAEKAAQEVRKAAQEREEAARKEAERLAQEEAERRRKAAVAEAEAQAREEERQRKAREEENRLAEERAKAEAAAAATAAEMSRNRGQKGGVSSLRTRVTFRDVDREKLDYAKLGPYFKDDHIKVALNAFKDANKATVQNGIKTGNQPIDGVIFYEDTVNSGRA